MTLWWGECQGNPNKGTHLQLIVGFTKKKFWYCGVCFNIIYGEFCNLGFFQVGCIIYLEFHKMTGQLNWCSLLLVSMLNTTYLIHHSSENFGKDQSCQDLVKYLVVETKSFANEQSWLGLFINSTKCDNLALTTGMEIIGMNTPCLWRRAQTNSQVIPGKIITIVFLC